MRAVIVYESMYGNTHLVAAAIGTGLGTDLEVTVVPVHEAREDLVLSADLLIVGGPTHIHSMSSGKSRAAAAEAASKDATLELEPDAEGTGLRDWFKGLDRIDGDAAAFDTRMPGPALLTGRASKAIARHLHSHGATLIAEPESFLVTKDNHLEADEEARAQAWGRELAGIVAKKHQASNPA